MTEPHHHVFNALQQAVIRGVKIEAILPHLVQKKIIPEADTKRYESNPQNGMKILISYLRNRSYETFLDFTECIFLAQKESPAKAQSTIIDSMIMAVQDFDQRNNTTHAQGIIDIQQKYMKQVTEEPETEVKQPLVVEKEETEDVPSPLAEMPLTGGKSLSESRIQLYQYHCMVLLSTQVSPCQLDSSM